jgi:hypothetical protein
MLKAAPYNAVAFAMAVVGGHYNPITAQRAALPMSTQPMSHQAISNQAAASTPPASANTYPNGWFAYLDEDENDPDALQRALQADADADAEAALMYQTFLDKLAPVHGALPQPQAPQTTKATVPQHPTLPHPVNNPKTLNPHWHYYTPDVKALIDAPEERTKGQDKALFTQLRTQGLTLRECAQVMQRPFGTIGYWNSQLKTTLHTSRTEELLDTFCLPLEDQLSFNRSVLLHLQQLAMSKDFTQMKPETMMRLMIKLMNAQQKWVKQIPGHC